MGCCYALRSHSTPRRLCTVPLAADATPSPTQAVPKLSPRQRRIAKKIEYVALITVIVPTYTHRARLACARCCPHLLMPFSCARRRSKAQKHKPASQTTITQQKQPLHNLAHPSSSTSAQLHLLDCEQLTTQATKHAATIRRVKLQLQALHASGAAAPPDASIRQERLLAQQEQAQQQLEAVAGAAAARSSAFSRQQLADIAWAVAHYSSDAAASLEAAMKVPFRVLPCRLPHIQLQVSGALQELCLLQVLTRAQL